MIVKNREELVKYLRDQAYWINLMADQIESGHPVTNEWCVDLEVPAVKEILRKEQEYQARLMERDVKSA